MIREREGSNGGAGKVMAFFLGLALLVLVGMAGFHYLMVQPAASPLVRLAGAVEKVFETETKIVGSSVILGTEAARELVVVKRRAQSMVKYQTEWMGSEKLVIVQGDFEIRAGFDLSDFEGFELAGERVLTQWPAAEVLGVELLEQRIFYSKDGLVNKLKPRDFERVSNLLQAQARRDAQERSDIREEAERVLRQRLGDLIGGGSDIIP